MKHTKAEKLAPLASGLHKLLFDPVPNFYSDDMARIVLQEKLKLGARRGHPPYDLSGTTFKSKTDDEEASVLSDIQETMAKYKAIEKVHAEYLNFERINLSASFVFDPDYASFSVLNSNDRDSDETVAMLAGHRIREHKEEKAADAKRKARQRDEAERILRKNIEDTKKKYQQKTVLHREGGPKFLRNFMSLFGNVVFVDDVGAEETQFLVVTDTGVFELYDLSVTAASKKAKDDKRPKGEFLVDGATMLDYAQVTMSSENCVTSVTKLKMFDESPDDVNVGTASKQDSEEPTANAEPETLSDQHEIEDGEDEEPVRELEFKPATTATTIEPQKPKLRVRSFRHRFIIGFAFGNVAVVDVVITLIEKESGKSTKLALDVHHLGRLSQLPITLGHFSDSNQRLYFIVSQSTDYTDATINSYELRDYDKNIDPATGARIVLSPLKEIWRCEFKSIQEKLLNILDKINKAKQNQVKKTQSLSLHVSGNASTCFIQVTKSSGDYASSLPFTALTYDDHHKCIFTAIKSPKLPNTAVIIRIDEDVIESNDNQKNIPVTTTTNILLMVQPRTEEFQEKQNEASSETTLPNIAYTDETSPSWFSVDGLKSYVNFGSRKPSIIACCNDGTFRVFSTYFGMSGHEQRCFRVRDELIPTYLSVEALIMTETVELLIGHSSTGTLIICSLSTNDPLCEVRFITQQSSTHKLDAPETPLRNHVVQLSDKNTGLIMLSSADSTSVLGQSTKWRSALEKARREKKVAKLNPQSTSQIPANETK